MKCYIQRDVRFVHPNWKRVHDGKYIVVGESLNLTRDKRVLNCAKIRQVRLKILKITLFVCFVACKYDYSLFISISSLTCAWVGHEHRFSTLS